MSESPKSSKIDIVKDAAKRAMALTEIAGVAIAGVATMDTLAAPGTASAGTEAALAIDNHANTKGNVNSLISHINQAAAGQTSFIEKLYAKGDHRVKKYHGPPLTPDQISRGLGEGFKAVDVYTMSIPTGKTTKAIGDIKAGLRIYNDYMLQLGDGANSNQLYSIKIVYGSVHPDHAQPNNPFSFDPYPENSTTYTLTLSPEAQNYQVGIISSKANNGKVTDSDIKASDAYTIVANQVVRIPDSSAAAGIPNPVPASVSEAAKGFQKILDQGNAFLHQ